MDNDIIGKQFGLLTVVRQVDDYIAPSGGTHKRYLCRCECGTSHIALKEHLTSGRTRSCGCIKKDFCGHPTHREIHTRLYRIWGNMVNRCTNHNNPAWENYGGRGITVCDEWLSYENFRDWANSSGYTNDLSIDRKDNNLGYTPDNCRWSDLFTQANNKRNTIYIEYNGNRKPLSQWARELGIKYKTLHRRVCELNWDTERAFTQPTRKHMGS